MACCALAAFLFGCAVAGVRRLHGHRAADTRPFAPVASRPGPAVPPPQA
jgi:hypothetical protein